ncbi:hypothetical protein [Aurantiacibacter suaedae]|uniref:hypothetical protein n=1 Tax=Aurantiacibacter suaedae TaxID=2545755 RepID=UPI0010F6DF3A|nr:hypothetical protein [Aurantiacibacter suaedae]
MPRKPHKLFERTMALNYTPTTLEGFGCLLGFILLSGVLVGLGVFFGEVLDSEVPVWFTGALVLVGFGMFMKFVRNHS